MPRCAALLLVAAGLAPAFAAGAPVVLNEVLYDPPGADAGFEFVELFNPGPAAVPLAGARLEFANGAEAPAWQVRWTGVAADSIAGGGFFLIADRGWTGPPPQAIAVLSLQNGPDAVRLVLPTGEVDRLGYGELDQPELYEGHPCAEPPAGQSLVRHPDGHDTDDNAADWEGAASPSPGGANFRPYLAEIESSDLLPPSLAAPGSVQVRLRIRNAGLAAWGEAEARLLSDRGDSAAVRLPALGPQEARDLPLTWRPAAAGRHELRLRLLGAAGGQDLLVPVGPYQVGPAELVLGEVMAAPASGGCEWVELAGTVPDTLRLEGYRLRDADGDWHDLPEAAIPPYGLVLLVQSAERFAAWWQDLLASGARPPCGAPAPPTYQVVGGWPSLNNSPPTGRDYADRVELGDSLGCTLDHLVLGDAGSEVPAGRSLERVAIVPRGDPRRNWAPSVSLIGGTPGCASSLAGADPAGRLELAPNPFRPAGEQVLHLRFRVPDGARAWDACVFDLWGRRVRDLGGDDLGPGPREVLWDGGGDDGTVAVPGGYVVVVRLYGAGGALHGARRRLAVLAPARP